jgi:AraC-like DNA-binding protein
LAIWYQAAGFISMAIYLVLSLRFYTDYKKLVFDKVSFAESILFQWIRNFVIAFLVVLTLRGVFFFTNSVWEEYGSQFWYYLCFSLIFYYISINGYSNAIRISALSDVKSKEIDVFKQELEMKEEVVSDEKNIEEWKQKISVLMGEQEVFKNPRLTLSDLATKLNTTTKTISYTVNNGFQMNFNDFINLHRIEAVKKKLSNKEHKSHTLLGIALDCGFNSKATFNRSFKKFTGMNPQDFLKNNA